MNSYGSDWGDNGYFWMSYDNVEKYLIEGYVMYREDGFEGWKETIASPNYCRFIKDDLLYEGGMDEDNFLHGSCFEIEEGKWGATGTYVHGYRHGTWLMCDYSTSENGFFGYVEFDQGEIVDNESFGFATTDIVTHNEADQLLGLLNLELDQNQNLKNPESLGQEKRSSAFVLDEGNDDDLGCIFGAKDKTNYQVLKTGYKAKILFSGGWGADFIIELEGSIYSENLSDVYFIKDGFCSWEDNVIVIDDEVFGVAQVEKL